MIRDIDGWMGQLLGLVSSEFGARLLFFGLQGSYQRGEANEHSDIDVVLVLDELATADLAAYRRILAGMPQHGLACGFVCGVDALRNWARSDLFQLLHDTRAYFGELIPLAGNLPTREDVLSGARLAVGNLYHEACHQCLYGDPAARGDALKGAYKSLFYVMQALEYTRTGVYHATRAQLLAHAAPEDREMLLAYQNWDGDFSVLTRLEALLRWCQRALAQLAE